MTHLPLEDRNVVGTAGPRYEPKNVCAHPFCNETTGLEKHHLWRRSFLGGGFNWVVLPDGKHVGNVVKLCLKHHQEITENKKSIVWWKDHFEIIRDEGDAVEMFGSLKPQPPLGFTDFPEEDVAQMPPDGHWLYGEAGESLTEPSGGIIRGRSWPLHGSLPVPHEGEECELCKRRVPKKRKPTTPTSKVHSFRLPLDQTDQLEEIWEAVAKHLGVQENSYYKGEAVLRAFVIALQGPGASE